VKEDLGADAALRFTPHRPADLRGNAQFRYYLGVRTEKPLFEYREPAPGEARYSPKDLIPFEVDFHPDDRGLFKARDFTVQVTLVPAPEAGREKRSSTGPGSPGKPLSLSLVMPAEQLFRYEPIAGSPGLMLDGKPEGPRNPNLVGPFFVEVLIKGTGGPLRGAERRLIRRTIHTRDYPELKTASKELRLSNTDENSIRASLPVELDLATEPTGHLADLTAEVRADTAKKSPLAATDLVIAHGQERDRGDKLHLYGRQGVFHVELPAGKWNSLPPGEHKGLTVQVRTPWSSQPVAVPLTVVKERYRPSAPSVVLDFSGKSPSNGKQELPIALNTRLQTEERVFLSTEKKQLADDNPGEAATQTVNFQGDGDKMLQVEVAGLGGKGVLVKGGMATGGVLRLSVTPKGTVTAGRYQRTLYLVGPSIEPTPITVEVVADQPGIVMAEPAGDWIKSVEGRPKYVQDVHLLGLAGTRVQRRFALYSQQTRAVVSSTPGADLLRLGEGQRDHFPLKLAPGNNESVDLTIPIPLEVTEGLYSTRLHLKGANGVLVAQLPIQMQVVHYGTRTRETGPARLDFGQTCGGVASGKVTLYTEVENTPIRWRVVRAAVAELEKEGRPGDILPEGRLDVEAVDAPGRSLLGEQPKNPLSSRSDLALKLLARCDRLAPGLYWARLLFYAREDDSRAEEGKPWGLDVQVLVPGRVVQALPPPDARARVGLEVQRHVRVSCYGCEPGQGSWRPVNSEGAAAGAEEAVTQPVKTEEDSRIPGLKHYTYAIRLKADRAGKNVYRVAWPAVCPENTGENRTQATVEVNARGVIKVIPEFAGHREKEPDASGVPEVVFRDEKVTVKAAIDPASLPEGDLQLQAVNRKEADRQPTTITLQHQGGGVYVGEHHFDAIGDYEIRLAPHDGLNLELDPALVRVGFTLDASSSLGTIVYGGGSLGSRPDIKVPGAVRLVNKEGVTCRWKARVRYPDSVEISRNIFQKDLAEATSQNYDENRHLQTRLFLGDGSDEMKWVDLAGTLEDDQTLELGIESKLPEPALKELAENKARTHPVLGSTNGMAVELQLEWRDADGQLLGRRTVLWPFVVSTGDSYLLYYLIAAGVLVVVAAPFAIRHFLRRRRQRRPTLADTEGEQDYLRESKQEKPAPAAKKGAAPARTVPKEGEPAAIQEGPATPPAKPKATPSSGAGMVPPDVEPPSSGEGMLPDYLR
jgi:hypothetical protein